MEKKNQWWENLDEDDLISSLPLSIFEVNELLTIEEAGFVIADSLPKGNKIGFTGNLWLKIKQEFHLLICTNDKKYSETRNRLINAGGETKTIIVAIISASIGDNLGLAAGVISPFCLLCLFSLLHIGKEAFCNNNDKLHVPIKKNKKK